MEDCDLCAWAEAVAKRTAAVAVDSRGRLVLPAKVRRGLGVPGGGVLLFARTSERRYDVVALSRTPQKSRGARKRMPSVTREESRKSLARVVPMTPPRAPN